MKPRQKLYEFHVANLREIEHAMSRIACSLRVAISQGDDPTASSFLRLYIFLLGAWAECRLKKLLYEPNGFDEDDRRTIVSASSQLAQWTKALELGFRKQYHVPKASLTINSLPHSAFSRYDSLSRILNDDLRSVVELRNKLAHGQWKYPLNDAGDDVAQRQMDDLRKENILSLQFKKSLLISLAATIHDLVISRPTFERDFDAHFEDIVRTRQNLQTRSYEKYVNNMKNKYRRGIERRRTRIDQRVS